MNDIAEAYEPIRPDISKEIEHLLQAFYLNLLTFAEQNDIPHDEMAAALDRYDDETTAIDGDIYLEQVDEWSDEDPT